MKLRFLIPVTMVLTVLVWMVLSWPLPLHMTTAIPVSPHGGGAEQTIRNMVPGDALQFLYYFQLVKEWFSGTTPWFYNMYEFNTGSDAERYFPGGYYAPFSLFYTLGAVFLGPAFGVNITGLISLWITMLGTWLLLRRFTRDEWIVALFSIFVLIFPYRWKTLFEASPTGLAMMWIPLLILGLDIAVRDGRVRGGVLAALAIVSAYLSDLHVFFFSVLVTPAYCLLVLSLSMPSQLKELAFWLLRTVRALAPIALAAILVFIVVQNKSASLQETHIESGRTLGEVRLFSPSKEGFFAWQGESVVSQIYLGWSITGLIVLGGLAMTVLFLKRPREEFRQFFFWGLLLMGAVLISVLSLGPHGLRSGGLFSLVREMIPPYAMIRQAGKIFCLMPTLLAIAGVLALSALIRVGQGRTWWRTCCLLVLGVSLFLEYTSISSPALTELRIRQSAYAAVAEDARAIGEEPRALVLVLWPGDSHFSSVYQHYAIQYRIRMVNGYTPSIRKDYYENIFLPFLSINQGYLSDDQANALLERGIRYILLHEDMYPEKVAPFPVTFAIKQYLQHSRLQLLEQGDRVWAFKILEAPREDAVEPFVQTRTWDMFFPARHWEMERSRQLSATMVEDEHASGGGYLILENNGALVSLARTGSPPAPNLRWMVRTRGTGRLNVKIYTGSDEPFLTRTMAVNSSEWQWLDIDAPISEFAEIALHLEWLSGRIELDSALLAAGTWTMLNPGESLTIPAPSFFHAGYTDLNTGHLVFQRTSEERRIIFYGPKMPLEPGRYNMEFIFDSNARHGTTLGELHLETDWNARQGSAESVVAGQPLRMQFVLNQNLPLNMSFVYFGVADMTVDQVVITRLE